MVLFQRVARIQFERFNIQHTANPITSPLKWCSTVSGRLPSPACAMFTAPGFQNLLAYCRHSSELSLYDYGSGLRALMSIHRPHLVMETPRSC